MISLKEVVKKYMVIHQQTISAESKDFFTKKNINESRFVKWSALQIFRQHKAKCAASANTLLDSGSAVVYLKVGT